MPTQSLLLADAELPPGTSRADSPVDPLTVILLLAGVIVCFGMAMALSRLLDG